MEQKDHPEGEPTGPVADELVKGMADVVTAALGVGAALARTAARASALGKPVPEPGGSQHPINLIVHYSLATAMNLVGAVATGVGGVSSVLRRSPAEENKSADSQPAPSPQTAEPAAAERQPEPPISSVAAQPTQVENATPAASTAGRPSVKQGNSLRIPLSIENPSGEALTGLRFQCLGIESAAPVEAHAEMPGLRCEPESLTIAAHDFEKLTVYIDVPARAQPGAYTAALGLAGQAEEGAGENFRTTITFHVLPGAASSNTET